MFSVICATRGRPSNMERLYTSCLSTANNADQIEFIWFIDDDDTPSIELAKKLNTKYLIAPRYSIKLSDTVNHCYKHAMGDIIFGAGDDIVFHTQGWDKIVNEAFERYDDRILLCGGYDGLNRDLITHPFLHRNWIETLERVVPPYFRDCYVDTWLNEVAQMIGRIEWLPIYIEHLHFSIGKSPMDQTASERMSKIQQNDEAGRIFLQTKMERILEAEKLNDYISSFKQSKLVSTG